MKTIDQAALEIAVQQIASALHPERIYLYGSHAYGEPHSDSDLDLLVVLSGSPTRLHDKAVVAYRSLRGMFIPAEIKVVTRTEFERRAQWSSSLERTVSEKAKVLYEAD